jgi:phosphoglycerate dehydrogenase-like enzyme
MGEGIVVLEEDADRYVDLLRHRGLAATGTDDPSDVIRAEVVLASPRLAARLGRVEGLGWIQSTWAGVDALVDAGVPAGVTVTSAGGIFGPQMREFVFAHLLAHVRRVVERTAAVSWDESPPGSLAASRIGIFGTGSIGGALAETARHFGMEVVGCSRSGTADDRFERVWPVGERLAFAEGLDHLVVVVPATNETRHLVDAAMIERLAPGATLVNVGRGSTVDVEAVVDGLAGGHLALAVLDVLEREPLPREDPLWEVPGLVITSHTAAWSSPEDVVEVFVTNLERYRRGEPLEGVVDPARGY